MIDDPIEKLADTRDELDRTVGAFERAQARVAVGSGRDETGEVLVRVRLDGALDDVVIGSRWIQRIEPEAMAAAVMAAYADASSSMVQSWGEAVVEESEDRTLRPMPSASDSLYATLGELADPARLAGQSEAALTQLAELLAQVNDELDEVSAEAQRVASRVVSGTSRGVTVSITGASVLTGVEIAPDWAARTNGNGIAQEVMRAFRGAQRQAKTHTVDDVLAASKLGELQRLGQDPQALISRLGLG